jgi:hypothetical protein
MNYVHIEAADPHRRDFARWCLAQDPPIQTASSTGSNVPVDLYPSVPVEFLQGAYVDGYRYDGPGVAQHAPKPAEVALEAEASVKELDAINPPTSSTAATRLPRRNRKEVVK